MQLMPQPPANHYAWLGRVTHACSALEVQIGMIAWAWENGQPWTENWAAVAGSPGMAWRRCEAATLAMDPDLAAEVSALLCDAKPVREERNKFAHAVFILDPTQPGDDQWSLKSARDPEFRPLSEQQGGLLVATAHRLSLRAQELRKRAAKESPARA